MSVYTREKLPRLNSQQLTSLPISVMNFASAIGRTTVGLTADRIGFMNAFILMVLISGFSQAIIWNLATDTYAGVMAFSYVCFSKYQPCNSSIYLMYQRSIWVERTMLH